MNLNNEVNFLRKQENKKDKKTNKADNRKQQNRCKLKGKAHATELMGSVIVIVREEMDGN